MFKNIICFLTNKFVLVCLLIVTSLASIKIYGADNLYEEISETIITFMTGKEIDISSDKIKDEEKEIYDLLRKERHIKH